MQLVELDSARLPGVPQFLVSDGGSAYRLIATHQITGRLAVLYTPAEPTGADCAAVVRKLLEG